MSVRIFGRIIVGRGCGCLGDIRIFSVRMPSLPGGFDALGVGLDRLDPLAVEASLAPAAQGDLRELLPDHRLVDIFLDGIQEDLDPLLLDRALIPQKTKDVHVGALLLERESRDGQDPVARIESEEVLLVVRHRAP
jgi:hypothetical protein